MTATLRYRASMLDEQIRRQGRRKDWLAEQIGIDPTVISHLIAGRRTANAELAEKITKALGLDDIFLAFELTSGSKSMPTEQAA